MKLKVFWLALFAMFAFASALKNSTFIAAVKNLARPNVIGGLDFPREFYTSRYKMKDDQDGYATWGHYKLVSLAMQECMEDCYATSSMTVCFHSHEEDPTVHEWILRWDKLMSELDLSRAVATEMPDVHRFHLKTGSMDMVIELLQQVCYE